MRKIKLSTLDLAVQIAIRQRLEIDRRGRSKWQKLADELDMRRDYLYQIAHNQRHATQAIAKTLGIWATRYAPHPVMRLSKLRRLMQSPYNSA